VDLFRRPLKIDFVSKRFAAYALSIGCIVLSLVSLAVQGLNFGIDFTGGTLVEMEFPQAVETAEIAQRFDSAGIPDASVQQFGNDRDGLLPPVFARVNRSTRTPVRIILVSGLVIASVAGLTPIGEVAQLVNIGTLAAFLLVCVGVVILRRTHPDLPRPFKAPWSPLTPVLGAVSSVSDAELAGGNLAADRALAGGRADPVLRLFQTPQPASHEARWLVRD
jgi:hypothetical protein